MSWAIGYDGRWKRDIGYGVPAVCDQPRCNTQIDRGLSFVCGGEPYGGEHGCGLYFCGDHMPGGEVPENDEEEYISQLCERCAQGKASFDPKPDTREWTRHKMTDPSWAAWRKEQGL